MNIRTTKITLVIGTLLVALVSSLVLFHPWHRAVIEGRTFSGLFGTPITFLPLVREIPVVWPFFVAGFLLGRLPGHSLVWAFGLGGLGAILECAIVRAEFAASPSVADYVERYLTLALPAAFTVSGLCVARLLRTGSRETK